MPTLLQTIPVFTRGRGSGIASGAGTSEVHAVTVAGWLAAVVNNTCEIAGGATAYTVQFENTGRLVGSKNLDGRIVDFGPVENYVLEI